VLIGFRDFSRLKGVSAAAVTTACKSRIKEAIVERNGKRMLDRDKALELWDRNTRRNGSERVSDEARQRDQRALTCEPGDASAVTAAEVSGVTPESLKTLIMGLPEDQIPGIDTSRERKAHYDAEVARLEALKERGELVPNYEVVREASRLARQVRDLLMPIASRNAAALATMQDTDAIRALLEGEIYSALRGLANA
jgi:hypothetical protein